MPSTGAQRARHGPNSDVEVMLDIEVAGAVAPGAQIAVYFAPNTDQGFIDAVSAAVHDTTHRPSVVSISWGGPEDSWTAQARTQMEQILTEGAGMGVTVTVAAGDNGSTDNVTDGKQHVDFPASAPHALACGGTNLQASGARISSETVWNTTDHGTTGGGVSTAVRAARLPVRRHGARQRRHRQARPGRPRRQRRRRPPERLHGARRWPGSGRRRHERRRAPVGGADRAAQPVARRALGFAQPRLYPLLGTAAFHDITSGSNGSYRAGPGWDACTGLGSPDGTQLAQSLAGTG